MTKEQQDRLIKYVEFVLAPINGKFVKFGEPIEMYVSIRPFGSHADIMAEENKIIIHHMEVKTDPGEITMSFRSDEIDDPRWAICVACAYSFPNGKDIPPEKWQAINKQILDLYRKEI